MIAACVGVILVRRAEDVFDLETKDFVNFISFVMMNALTSYVGKCQTYLRVRRLRCPRA